MKKLIFLTLSGVIFQNSFAQESATTSKTILPSSDTVTKSSFGALFYTLGGYDDKQFKAGSPSYGIYDSYVSLTWKLSKNVRLSALPTFGYNTAGNDYAGKEVTDKFYWRDFSFAVSQSQILEDIIPAELDLKQKARLYLPTSDGSKEEGMIARLRLEMEGRYNFDRYSNIRYYAKPSYYFQRTTAFLSKNSIRNTKLADIQHGPEGSYDLGKMFALKPGFEIEDNWSNKSDVNDSEARHTSVISYRMGLEVRPSSNFNFTVGIQDKRDLIDPSVTPIVSYSLLTNLVIY